MAAIRVRLSSTTALTSGSAQLRARLATVESSVAASARLRARLAAVSSAVGNFPNARVRVNAIESTVGNYANLHARVVAVECLQAILEPSMSSVVFPTLQGLTFDVSKKPIFSTKIADHVSGEETATSYYQNPKWEYKLTYDYLPDRPKAVGETDLHTLMGVFLQMRGRGDTFLFQDPDDYSVVDGFQADMDGVTTQIKLVRGIGGFYEPIGQLNSIPTLQVWLALTQSGTIPGSGPYAFTVTHAAAYSSTNSVTIAGVAATLATGAPAAGQYSVAAGVYTFNSADAGKAVVVRYQYLVDPSAYSITMPNVLIYVTAPPAGSATYASFNYYFVCRFLEDSSEYTKFMDKLWNLSELGFRSIPQ